MDELTHLDVDFLWTRRFTTAAHLRESELCQDYDQINIIHAGVSCIRTTDQELTAGAGDVLYFPAGYRRVEWNDPARPMTCQMVFFNTRPAMPELPICCQDLDGRVAMMGEWLRQWTFLPELPVRLLRNTVTAAILAEYARLSRRLPRADLAFCREVSNFIVANYRKSLTLADIAEGMNLSRHHLVRRFRAATGTTPMAALRHFRLQQAISLLRTTRQTADEIAYRVGLRGQGQLSRLLRRHHDTCPREIRRQSGVE